MMYTAATAEFGDATPPPRIWVGLELNTDHAHDEIIKTRNYPENDPCDIMGV